MKAALLFMFMLTLILTPTKHSFAVDIGDTLQLHGFASQGYLHSSGNNFLAQSRNGSIKFSDIALNANWQPFGSLRFGAQGYYRNLGDYNENRIVLDWGLVDYQPYDELGLRLGKIKMPLGLYNEVRDSNFLLPMIFLPQSIYDESRRDTNLAYTGASTYGNISLKSWGDLDYQLFYGEESYPDESIQEQSNTSSIISAINRNSILPDSKKNPFIPDFFTSIERQSRGLYGASLVYNAPYGLRISATVQHSKSEITLKGINQPVGDTVVHGRFVLSAEYSSEHWLLVSEYSESDRTMTQFGATLLDGPSQSWYAMVCYSPLHDWTISLLYDEFYRLKHDKDNNERPDTDPATGWRRDLGIGLRYDVSNWCNIKAEYHYIDGTAMQLRVLNSSTERYWSYFAAKLSVGF